MTAEEQLKIVKVATDQLSEHFEAVQIHCSTVLPGGNTRIIREGRGNIYARVGMCREMIERDQAINALDATKESDDNAS